MTSRFPIPSSAFLLVVFVACGGSKPPPPSPVATKAEPDAGPATKPDDEDAKSARQAILDGCGKVAPEPYCTCVADEFEKQLTKDDLAASTIDPARLVQIHRAVDSKCTPIARKILATQCSGGDDFAMPYCECFSGKMLGEFEPMVFWRPDVRASDPFLASELAAARACDSKMPRDKVHDAMVGSCMKDAPRDWCQCTWEQMVLVMAPAEMFVERATESASFKRGQANVERECAKLRPKARPSKP